MTSQDEIRDLDVNQRRRAVKLLKEKFDHQEDKDQVWMDLHSLTQDTYIDVRRSATEALITVFSQIPNKSQAWQDLISLTQDEDRFVRERAAGALKAVFPQVPDRDQAWQDLISLTQDEDRFVRERAAGALKAVFPQVPDRDQVWQDLISLTQDEDRFVRERAAGALKAVFQQVPDRDQAWQDLISLTQDTDIDVRRSAIEALGTAFSQAPDKEQAWQVLRSLTQDTDIDVRWSAAGALEAVFPQVPDRDQAWQDLISLTQDEDSHVRWSAADALGTAFSQAPDKEQAWQVLRSLTQDEDRFVRESAAGALGSAFSHVPDKEQAWQDLISLTQDEDRFVRERAAGALGSAFSHVPDKEQAWQVLHSLTQDENSNVRSTSNHSLGRISILRATESDDEFRTYLEEAIEFFRRSSEEAEKYFNPAAFCLPFYLSLHSLLFTEIPREDEVQRYLAEAKEAIEASESREVLLEAVNNLSKALQEIRSYSIDDITLRKRDLRSYTKYCLQTAECLREARDKAPLAFKIIDYTLIEKSIPIVDQKIKALFRNVEAATGKLCKSTKGTDLEAFGKAAYESTKGLNKVESWIAADQYLERIVPLLKRHCSRLPKEAQEHLKTLVDSQDTASLELRLNTLESVLLASLVQGENDDRRVIELKGLLNLRLQGIEFAIINMKENSGNARKELYSLKNLIDGLQREIESQGLDKMELSKSLEERDRTMIDRLNKLREDLIQAVRDTARLNASKRDIEAILKEIDNQDRLKKRDVLGIITDISSLAGMALTILL